MECDVDGKHYKGNVTIEFQALYTCAIVEASTEFQKDILKQAGVVVPHSHIVTTFIIKLDA